MQKVLFLYEMHKNVRKLSGGSCGDTCGQTAVVIHVDRHTDSMIQFQLKRALL